MQSFKAEEGRLLLVIPPVIEVRGEEIFIDGDFANNLEAYLAAFGSVHLMCPPTSTSNTFPSTVRSCEVPGAERLRVTVLPIPYREDRYFYNRRGVKRALTIALLEADFRLISPHAAFDWSTLAAGICRRMGLKFNMEADWNLPEVRKELWQSLPFGLNKLRRGLGNWWHDRQYFRSLAASSLSLLQGGDVFNDLSPMSPNPFRVLNVQITSNDHINAEDLTGKLDHILSGGQIRLIYTGRAEDIKGPIQWLDVVTLLRDWGCNFNASWLGDGRLLPEMRRIVAERHLGDVCSLPGKVDRSTARAMIQEADIFLFCHLAKESPRCLVEALGFGTPIVGFGTNYPKALVSQHGGGLFVDRGKTHALAEIARDLMTQRPMLADLVRAAAASGRELEMTAAIEERINLMKKHLS